MTQRTCAILTRSDNEKVFVDGLLSVSSEMSLAHYDHLLGIP